MHVSVAVLGAVVVSVGVLVLDVLVFVLGVGMCVSDPRVLMLVRVRSFMGVVVMRHDPYLLGCVFGGATACSGVSVR
jgi:cytochrome c oxidase assembly factor CtaG